MITRYGYSTFGIVALVAILIIACGILIHNNFIKYPLIVTGVGIFLFTLNFFRDPERRTPQNENAIFSPADGEIIIIKEVKDRKYIGEEAWQISIFMSPLNVHVNRIPIDGKVDYLHYQEGDYLVAFHEKADERNERNEIGILGKHGKVFFTQVAGAMARRIVSELEPGQAVKAGERFGMIKFGSRSDIIVPKKWNVNVKLGDKVFAGESILYDISN